MSTRAISCCWPLVQWKKQFTKSYLKKSRRLFFTKFSYDLRKPFEEDKTSKVTGIFRLGESDFFLLPQLQTFVSKVNLRV